MTAQVFDQTDWNIAQTFSWICLRDPEQLDRATVPHIVPWLETTISPVITLATAEGQIRQLLSQSRLSCTGVRDGKREAIPSSAWKVRRFLMGRGSVKDLTSNEEWEAVLFTRLDILALWPSIDPQMFNEKNNRPESQRVRTGPKPGQRSNKSKWGTFATECLDSGRVIPGHGAPAEIARLIQAEDIGKSYSLDTIEKVTRGVVKDWNRK